LTTASYIQINALVEKYPDLVVLGFPCNQFGKQEPGANATEILDGIRHVRPGNNFETKVTQFFQKVEVNGDFQIDLYSYLKNSCEPTFSKFEYTDRLFYEPLVIGDIAWNFEKFLIGRDGKPKFRYHPHLTDPEHLEMNNDIVEGLQETNPFENIDHSSQGSSLHARSNNEKPSPFGGITKNANLKGKIVVNEPLSP